MAKKTAKKTAKKSAKRSNPAKKTAKAKSPGKRPAKRSTASSARATAKSQPALPTTRRPAPMPQTIDSKRFKLNAKKLNLRIRGRNLQMSQPTRFVTTDPAGISWTWEVVNNNSPVVMVVHATPTKTRASTSSGKKPVDETGDLTITIISDGQLGEVTFDDIVFEEP